MNPGIITQARMGSTRLPGKVMKPIQGKPLLEYHLERASRADLPIYVATSKQSQDDSIVRFVSDKNVSVFRGSEENVLSRYLHCATEYEIDPIIRITSDCPLIDGDLIIKGLALYKNHKTELDYLSNTLDRTFPRGFDFEVFSLRTLKEGYKKSDSKREQEHVTPVIYENPDSFNLKNFEADHDHSDLRVTVDYPEDFELLNKLIKDFDADEKSWRKIIQILRNHPNLQNINADVEQLS